MANIKQQIKRNKQNEKARLRNATFKSSLRSAVKKVEDAVSANDFEAATLANNVASKKLDKAVSKGLAHKNYVARQKSRLAKLVNSVK